MTEKEKELLLKDLCSRLLHGVKVYDKYAHPHAFLLKDGDYKLTAQNIVDYLSEDPHDYNKRLENIKPYLRPMSSMTEEEKKELLAIVNKETKEIVEQIKNKDCGIMEGKYHFNSLKELDWLNEHHFDYRGLIPMGLALEAPEGMYNII